MTSPTTVTKICWMLKCERMAAFQCNDCLKMACDECVQWAWCGCGVGFIVRKEPRRI